MSAWNPDLEFIDRLETHWAKDGDLDKPWREKGSTESIAEILDVFEKDTLEIDPSYIRHIEETYGHDGVCDVPHTLRDRLDAMREGTPFGVLDYIILTSHAHCCMPKDLYE